MNLDLSGKYAFVGGSTQGIGKKVAIELSKLGATVVLAARNEDKLKATLLELDRNLDQDHSYICADFSNPKQLEEEVKKMLASGIKINILVNNTGGPKAGKAIDADSEDYIAAFHLHLVCNQILASNLVEGMKEGKYGRIINIISTSVKAPLKGLGVSNTIRGAVASWSKTLAGELGEFGITVNNVLPGATNTSRLKDIIANKAKQSGQSEEDVMKSMTAAVPLGRVADPKEIAAAVVFLSSPAASYINGINLPVDGGRTPTL